MRYIDNGIGDPLKEPLFPWLQDSLTEDVIGIRWQSGYFEAGILGLFVPTLKRLAKEEQDTIILIGSNEGETLAAAVHKLVDTLELPRQNALLGVVSFSGGFYHPKTVHLQYPNDREAAYVGSANMTARGINGLNVEAGIILDTEEGDPVELLSKISRVAYEWFDGQSEGLFRVDSHDDVDQLQRDGILADKRLPRQRRGEYDNAERKLLPRRTKRHVLPLVEEDNTFERDGPPESRETEAAPYGDVLIAELSGPGRWGQAAFPQWFIENFFKVLPGTGEVLRLFPVTLADGVGLAEERTCGYKQGSKNWYFELGLAAEIGTYPPRPHKPIGVFHRIGHQKCRYTILMPDNESYTPVSDFLAQNRDRLRRRRNELPRTIVPANEFRIAWPNNWFFGT